MKVSKKIIGGKSGVAGMGLVELLIVLLVVGTLCAIGIPATRSSVAKYQLSAAVDTVTGAIQSTRYLAIRSGYPYQIQFDATQNTYQILSEVPPATSFSTVGSAVPLSSSPVTLSAATTLQFKANGAVSATVGAMNFSITYNHVTKTLTVSNYGSISVQ
jgi:Tfp pilus assembly protein FimT